MSSVPSSKPDFKPGNLFSNNTSLVYPRSTTIKEKDSLFLSSVGPDKLQKPSVTREHSQNRRYSNCLVPKVSVFHGVNRIACRSFCP